MSEVSILTTEMGVPNLPGSPGTSRLVVIIIIIIIMIIISFMQGIYAYIPETNHVPREYSVSPILSLVFMVPISLVPALALLYFTLALTDICVQCPI